MERLSVTQHGSHSLDTGTTYIVERVLLRKTPTRGLRVGTQSQRLRILSTKRLHNLSPQQTACTHLGYFHEVVHTDSPEERQTRSEGIDVDTSIHASTQIVHTIGQGVSQLDVGSSTSLLHVVARDRDRVELRHLLRGVLEDIGNDFHRECRRIDIGVAHHELLQNIVLDGSCHFLQLSALLQACYDVECQDRQHGTVHRHRDGHLVQGDA